jgi:hypothetical protein
MKPWSLRPGEKVIVTRRALEDLAHHLENPEMSSPNQFKQDAKTITEQLANRTNAHES